MASTSLTNCPPLPMMWPTRGWGTAICENRHMRSRSPERYTSEKYSYGTKNYSKKTASPTSCVFARTNTSQEHCLLAKASHRNKCDITQSNSPFSVYELLQSENLCHTIVVTVKRVVLGGGNPIGLTLIEYSISSGALLGLFVALHSSMRAPRACLAATICCGPPVMSTCNPLEHERCQ